jgi:hypothetical protein
LKIDNLFEAISMPIHLFSPGALVMNRLRRLSLVCLMLLNCDLVAFSADDIRELKLRDWEPKSMLVTKATVVEKPRFPVIDIHNHLGGGRQTLTPERGVTVFGDSVMV